MAQGSAASNVAAWADSPGLQRTVAGDWRGAATRSFRKWRGRDLQDCLGRRYHRAAGRHRRFTWRASSDERESSSPLARPWRYHGQHRRRCQRCLADEASGSTPSWALRIATGCARVGVRRRPGLPGHQSMIPKVRARRHLVFWSKRLRLRLRSHAGPTDHRPLRERLGCGKESPPLRSLFRL